LRRSNLGQGNERERKQRDQTAKSARHFQQHSHLPPSWDKGKAGLGDLFALSIYITFYRQKGPALSGIPAKLTIRGAGMQ
jgi:hypothetical protein